MSAAVSLAKRHRLAMSKVGGQGSVAGHGSVSKRAPASAAEHHVAKARACRAAVRSSPAFAAVGAGWGECERCFARHGTRPAKHAGGARRPATCACISWHSFAHLRAAGLRVQQATAGLCLFRGCSCGCRGRPAEVAQSRAASFVLCLSCVAGLAARRVAAASRRSCRSRTPCASSAVQPSTRSGVKGASTPTRCRTRHWRWRTLWWRPRCGWPSWTSAVCPPSRAWCSYRRRCACATSTWPHHALPPRRSLL